MITLCSRLQYRVIWLAAGWLSVCMWGWGMPGGMGGRLEAKEEGAATARRLCVRWREGGCIAARIISRIVRRDISYLGLSHFRSFRTSLVL